MIGGKVTIWCGYLANENNMLLSQIARNVIDEKENNMKSIKESLEAEKEQKVKLEKVSHYFSSYHHRFSLLCDPLSQNSILLCSFQFRICWIIPYRCIWKKLAN